MTYPVVTLQPRRIAYTASSGDPSTSDAFARLEQVVPLKGNRFYATFDAQAKEYRACVALREGKSADEYRLPEGLLAGGRYASARLAGPFGEIVRQIAPTFAQMRAEHTRDPARLPIEFYSDKPKSSFICRCWTEAAHRRNRRAVGPGCTSRCMMPTLTQKLANPTRFMELSGRLLPWVSGLAGVLLIAGLAMAFTAPLDYQQGHAAKIMFVHVPSAWLSMFGYALVAISSFGLLVFRHPLADVSAKAAAPLGAAFTFLCLVTGMLWGKPMWGAYWVWDPRLTSVLILFFLYLGLIALRSSIEDEALAAKLTAVLALVGIVMLPVIKFSVEWNSLHQPASVMRLGAPTIHPSLLWPLLVMALAMTVLFAALHLKAMRNEILRRRVKALRTVEVEGAGGLAGQPAE